jgi:hypothetical protein
MSFYAFKEQLYLPSPLVDISNTAGLHFKVIGDKNQCSVLLLVKENNPPHFY